MMANSEGIPVRLRLRDMRSDSDNDRNREAINRMLIHSSIRYPPNRCDAPNMVRCETAGSRH